MFSTLRVYVQTRFSMFEAKHAFALSCTIALEIKPGLGKQKAFKQYVCTLVPFWYTQPLSIAWWELCFRSFIVAKVATLPIKVCIHALGVLNGVAQLKHTCMGQA